MKKLLLFLVIFASFAVHGQTAKTVSRPKVVVGLVVDQMRWDYLYKFYHLYGDNGFKRLLNNGYSCQNTMVNYLPSHTAPGHTGIYTGSVPYIHGIAGNAFIENSDGLLHDACEDKNVDLLGSDKKGSSSPKNLLATTMGDELRLSTGFKSRVFSIAIKNRGSIFPGGRLANAAYWYDDDQGCFTTSTYYMQSLPDWLVKFNKENADEDLIKYGWNLKPGDYSLCTPDQTEYEESIVKGAPPVFPYDFSKMESSARNDAFCKTPFGNTYTIMMARACIQAEKIGKGPHTDMLCVSFSSPDELAHQYGMNSVEMQDMMVKLDQDLAGFLSFLDQEYGAGNYLMFLTADHGGSHNQKFLTDINVPAGVFPKTTVKDLNAMLKNKFGQDSLVIGFTNYYQVFLNNPLLARITLSRPAIRQAIMDWFLEKPEVLSAVDLYNISGSNLPTRIKEMVMNGYNRRRGGDVQVILNPAWYEYAGKTKGNTHGTWSPADTHIPLLFFGWGVKKGETTSEHYTTDIAPTICAMLHIQMPNGCVGKPIQMK